LAHSGAEHAPPTLESNSTIVLFSHVRTGQWATIMPAMLAETLGLGESVRAIPIVEPSAIHTIGLVAPNREIMTTLAAALFAEAPQLATSLETTRKR
jgi:DNA-binding transcriptional LysR family regulator